MWPVASRKGSLGGGGLLWGDVPTGVFLQTYKCTDWCAVRSVPGVTLLPTVPAVSMHDPVVRRLGLAGASGSVCTALLPILVDPPTPALSSPEM